MSIKVLSNIRHVANMNVFLVFAINFNTKFNCLECLLCLTNFRRASFGIFNKNFCVPIYELLARYRTQNYVMLTDLEHKPCLCLYIEEKARFQTNFEFLI